MPLPLSPFTVSSHRDGGPSPVTVPFVQSRGFFPLRIPRPAANDDGFIFTAGKHQTTRCRPLLGAKCQRASGRTGTGKEYTEASRMLLPSSWMGSWPFTAACDGSPKRKMESPGFVIVIMPLICFPTTTIQFADIKSHTQKINHRDLLPQAAWKRPTQNHGRTPRRKSLMPWLYHTSLASSIYTCVWLPESRYMDVP